MYIVASDIGADLPKQWIVGGFHKINQSILVDGKSVVVPFDDQSLANFYTSLAHSQVKTTAMQQQEILPQLQQLVDKEGKDVLFVGFSSRLSGTATQIATCAQQVSQSGKVNVCFWDSLQASAGQALLVERALQNRQKGLSMQQNVADLEQNAHKIVFQILVSVVDRFSRGGRAQNLHSTQLLPILGLKRGCLYHTEGKFLSRDVAKAYWAQHICQHANTSQKLIVCHGSNAVECQQFAEQLHNATGMQTACCFANVLLGAHTGDNLVAVAYWAK